MKLRRGRLVLLLGIASVLVLSLIFYGQVSKLSVPNLNFEPPDESGRDIDSDNDGLSDYDEYFIYYTNETNWDTDGDGYSDYGELFYYTPQTDPLVSASKPELPALAIGDFAVNSNNAVLLVNISSDIPDATKYKLEMTDQNGNPKPNSFYCSPYYSRDKQIIVSLLCPTVDGGVETIYYRVSAVHEISVNGIFNIELRVSNYSDVIPAVFNFTYRQLDFSLQANPIQSLPGSVMVTAIPTAPADVNLRNSLLSQAEVYLFCTYGGIPGISSGECWSSHSEDGGNSMRLNFRSSSNITVRLSDVGNGFFSMYTKNKGLGSISPVLLNVSPPANTPFFPRFPLDKTSITITDGSYVILPFCNSTADTNYQLELPIDIQAINTTYTTYSVAKISGAQPGYQRFNYSKLAGQYNYFKLIFNTSLQSGIREMKLSCSSNWNNYQTINLTIKPRPNVALPKRLVTSFTWSNFGEFGKDYADYLSIYRGLGFNTVPGVGLHYQNPDVSNTKYFPEPANRTGPIWADMKYGVEHSTFHGTLYDSYSQSRMTFGNALKAFTWPPPNISASFVDSLPLDNKSVVLNGYYFDSGEYKLNASNTRLLNFSIIDILASNDYLNDYGKPGFAFDSIYMPSGYVLDTTNEYNLWSKAIAFYSKTEVIDMAYRGYFFQYNLELLRRLMARYKPDYIFIDTEIGYPSFELPYSESKTLVKQIKYSSNSARLYLPASQRYETDYEYAHRIADDFLGETVDAIHDGSSTTKISIYSSQATGNAGYFAFPFDILENHSIIIGPDVFTETRYKKPYCDMLKENRDFLDARLNPGEPKQEMLPWLSSGTYGQVEPEVMFNAVTETLLCGATGFAFYSRTDVDDFDEILKMSEAIGLIAPYEDIIMDGEFADSNIQDVVNAVVSGYKLNNNYLLALIPLNESLPVSFNLTVDYGNYTVTDLRYNQVSNMSGTLLSISKAITNSTVILIIKDSNCIDGVQNGGETGVDCGGPCAVCSVTPPDGGGGGGGGGGRKIVPPVDLPVGGDGLGGLGRCQELWQCGTWSECVNGTMTRACEDLKVCETEEDKPETQASCDTNNGSSGLVRYDLIFAEVIFIIGVIGIVVLFMLKLRSGKSKKENKGSSVTS